MDFYPPPSASSCHPRNCFLPPSLPREPDRLLPLLAPLTTTSPQEPPAHHHDRREDPQQLLSTCHQSHLHGPALLDLHEPAFPPTPRARPTPPPYPGATFLPRPPPFNPVLNPLSSQTFARLAVDPFFQPRTREFREPLAHRPRVDIYGPRTSPPICGLAYTRLSGWTPGSHHGSRLPFRRDCVDGSDTSWYGELSDAPLPARAAVSTPV